jgi:DNA uptake protein ComE-like DNA-binding protein
MNARLSALAFALLLTACGASAASGSALTTATTTSAAAAAATNGTAATTSATPASTTGAVAKVSANNASNAELIAAFTAAGIPNPASWAREVQEYRPYETSDTNLAKLRQNLVKYNPAAGVVDKIVATLSLP